MANLEVTRRASEDDFLECFLYPKFCFDSSVEHVSEAMLSAEIEKFNQEIAKYTNGYIWHRDRLEFHPRTKQALLLNNILDGTNKTEEIRMLPHIYGSLRYDEDVGDEWFAVFLIMKLTKIFEGLIAQLVDSDGEFLLIEAADVLPAWATPEKCENRVFLHDGAIHVVQQSQGTLSNFLNGIQKKPEISRMSDKVQSALAKKINMYPEEIQRRKHKARAFLPEKAASILSRDPGLVAPTVRAVCHSDPLERKVCRAMRYFPPEQRVMVNVKMTKCLYAMVTHCRYTGDPRTGWNLPPTSNANYGAHVLGVKLACGLELLVARANDDRRKRGKENVDDNEEGKLDELAWNAYLSRLESNGYFKDLLEGSKERETRHHLARDHFLARSNLSDPSTPPGESEAQKILNAWRNVQTCDVELQARDEAALSPADSDGWLNVDPTQLETMLGQHWSNNKSDQEPLCFRNKVEAFLNQTSDVDGVDFVGDQPNDEESKIDSEDSGRIDFDPDAFDNALRDILDLVVPGGDSEFEGSSEGSLGGDDEDRAGEMDKYMRLLDSQIQTELKKDKESSSMELVESNLKESMAEEAGGSGPAGNIVGGPIRRLMHLQLQSPTTVPPDLQS